MTSDQNRALIERAKGLLADRLADAKTDARYLDGMCLDEVLADAAVIMPFNDLAAFIARAEGRPSPELGRVEECSRSLASPDLEAIRARLVASISRVDANCDAYATDPTAAKSEAVVMVSMADARALLVNLEDDWFGEWVAASSKNVELANRLAALSTPSPERAEGAPVGEVEDEFASMLWRWFEKRDYPFSGEERSDGLTADDFAAMLDDHEAALSQPSQVEKEEADALRAEVLAIFKANKMASDERLAILIAERLAPRLNTPAPAAEPVAIKTVGWAALARNGNIRFWHADEMKVHDFACRHSCDVVRLVETPRPLGVSKAEIEEALRAADEALAQVTAFEDDARHIMGNTNFEIVRGRRAQVKSILAKLSSPGEEGWRPIETAPKDGTRFLAWPAELPDEASAAVETWWYEHSAVSGWITGAFDCGDYEFEPTHWMPLPPPPSSQEEGA